MSIHKLTAGDGYAYLTRQVAALDATDSGHTGLADYYSQRGESPGRWPGSALGDVDMRTGQQVTADQMASLFAEGRHPNADQITADLTQRTAGARPRSRRRRSLWARPFPRPDTPPAFQVAVARVARQVNAAAGCRGTGRWRRPSGPGSAPTSAGRCSPRSTAGRRRTRGSCPRSSPGTPGQRPARSPGST